MRCRECHKETGTISATTGLCNECDTKYREKHKGDIVDAKKEIQNVIYSMIDATVKDKRTSYAYKHSVLKLMAIDDTVAENWIKAKEEYDNDTSKREKSKE